MHRMKLAGDPRIMIPPGKTTLFRMQTAAYNEAQRIEISQDGAVTLGWRKEPLPDQVRLRDDFAGIVRLIDAIDERQGLMDRLQERMSGRRQNARPSGPSEIVPSTKRSSRNEPAFHRGSRRHQGRNPLADIAGGYVKLRRMGKRLVGPCPICGGKATSQRFEILEDGESWVCAVCPGRRRCHRTGDEGRGLRLQGAIERLGGQREIDAAAPKSCSRRARKSGSSGEKTSDDFREAERKRLWKTWQSPRDPRHHRRPLPRGPRPGAAGGVPRPALPPASAILPRRAARRARPQIADRPAQGPGDAGRLHPRGRQVRRAAHDVA
jgi:hypothetical protein